MSISSTEPTKFLNYLQTLTSSTPHMRVSINGGTPKWMVYNGTSQQKMDENWGYPYDLGNLHMDPWGTWECQSDSTSSTPPCAFHIFDPVFRLTLRVGGHMFFAQRDRWNLLEVTSGKHTKNYGKSPLLVGKPTISMAIFNSYGTNYQRVSIFSWSLDYKYIIPI